MRAKTAKWRVFMRGLKFASCHVWCVCWLRVAPLFKGVIRECVWLNGMEPDQTSHPNSCHLAQRVSFGGHFFPLRLPRDFTFPPSCEVFFFFFLGGGDMEWMSCVCVRTYLSVLCMCFPTTLHYALCSFGIFCWGTLCNISIPTTSQGSCDLRPAPSQQCISLHPPPPFLPLPFPPLSPFCGLQHCIN